MTAQSIRQTPDPLNPTLRQYQEWNIGFSYCNNQDVTDPISLVGFTPILQFRTSALAKTTVLSLTEGNGLTFNPTTCPQVQVSAPINCDPGKYEWDLRMDNEDGSIYLGEGIVIVEANVSR